MKKILILITLLSLTLLSACNNSQKSVLTNANSENTNVEETQIPIESSSEKSSDISETNSIVQSKSESSTIKPSQNNSSVSSKVSAESSKEESKKQNKSEENKQVSKKETKTENTTERLLNSEILSPTKTNCKELDSKIDEIFKNIIKSGMSNYQKVKACYDYLINNVTYGTTDYNYYFKAASYKYLSSNESMVVCNAYPVLMCNVGVCDNYSAAFVVMMRRLGYQASLIGGQVGRKNGGYSGHIWTKVKLNNNWYIFDPQVEDNNTSGGKINYYFFCCTDSAYPNMYKPSVTYSTDKFELFKSIPLSTSVTCSTTNQSKTLSYRMKEEEHEHWEQCNTLFENVEKIPSKINFNININLGNSPYDIYVMCRKYDEKIGGFPESYNTEVTKNAFSKYKYISSNYKFSWIPPQSGYYQMMVCVVDSDGNDTVYLFNIYTNSIPFAKNKKLR